MKKYKKIIIFNAILLIAIAILLLISYYQFNISEKKYNYGYNDLEFSRNDKEELKIAQANTIIEQKFKARYNKLERIKIGLKSNKDFEIKLKLINLTDDIIIKEENINNNLISNNYYILEFDKQEDSKGKVYSLLLDFNEAKDSDITIQYIKKNIAKERSILINNENFHATLEINEYYDSPIKEILFNLVAIVSVFVVVIVSIVIFLKHDMTAEKAFLYTVPIICIMFLVIMPMFKSHDEQRHWLRAYEISEGQFLTQIHDGKVESNLPKNVINPLNEYWRYIDYNDIKKATSVKLDNENRAFADMSYVAVYTPIQYIPQAIGISIARLFTDRILIMTYAARIANLIVAMGLIYLAIKTTPIGKKIFLLSSMFPLTIEAFSSMSPDALTISISFLFVAYILKLVFGENNKVNRKDIVILSILSIIIAFCKIVYIPLVFLLFIIPKEKFKSKRNKLLIITLIIITALILNIGWLITANGYLSLSSEGTSGGQVLNVLKHPIEYIKMFLYSLNVNGQRYLTSLFGGELGWNEFSLYFFVPYIFCALFVFTSSTDKGIKDKFTLFPKILITLIILIIFALIFTSLYVQWTKPGNVTIEGVQGRYFIPFIPLIGILLNSIKIENNYKDENILKTICITTLVLQIYILLTIAINHF